MLPHQKLRPEYCILLPGKAVSFTASLYHPRGADNPDGYDFREALLQRGITVGVYGKDSLTVQDPVCFSFAGFIASLRHRLSASLIAALGGETGAYASAMLLGMRSLIPSDDRQAFSRLGIAHILSVSGFHVGVLIGILNLNTGEGVAANAGHEHPVVCRKNGLYELVQYKHSPAVAVMEDMKFKEHAFRLHPGDRLFVYTDGVPEATDADNKMFGTDRMLEALNENPLSEPEELLPRVKTAIDAFVGDAPQFDDITMLGFHYRDNVTAGDAKELTLEASVENLNRVLDFLEGPMDSVECPLSVQTQLNIAVEEIFVNIAHYAYTPGKGDTTVRVETDKKNRSISVTFTDRGIPYNPLEKADPDTTLSAEERQIGGLGIFMVKKSMDAMEYRREDGMNILTIRKNC